MEKTHALKPREIVRDSIILAFQSNLEKPLAFSRKTLNQIIAISEKNHSREEIYREEANKIVSERCLIENFNNDDGPYVLSKDSKGYFLEPAGIIDLLKNMV